jgi:hypothetical protein
MALSFSYLCLWPVIDWREEFREITRKVFLLAQLRELRSEAGGP